MSTELTYVEKFAELTPWHPHIFTAIKKDLRDEHLKANKGFLKRYFPQKELKSLTIEDLLAVYPKLIAQAEFEPLAEFIANRWLLRHLEIYNFFEAVLKSHYSDIEKIDEIAPELSQKLLDSATAKFGAPNSYIFSILNCVAFSKAHLQVLKNAAIPTATA